MDEKGTTVFLTVMTTLAILSIIYLICLFTYFQRTPKKRHAVTQTDSYKDIIPIIVVHPNDDINLSNR